MVVIRENEGWKSDGYGGRCFAASSRAIFRRIDFRNGCEHSLCCATVRKRTTLLEVGPNSCGFADITHDREVVVT